jgi:hypothetical protein
MRPRCYSSKNKHATKRFHTTGHPVMESAETGAASGWCYIDWIQLDLHEPSFASGGNRDRTVMPEVRTMAEMLECIVTYFSQDADAEGMPHRYLSYHVVASLGPNPNGGVASITPLASYNENEICDTCERVIAVKAGGPAAALAEALVYMDAFHEGAGLRKVQSEIRTIPARTDMVVG